MNIDRQESSFDLRIVFQSVFVLSFLFALLAFIAVFFGMIDTRSQKSKVQEGLDAIGRAVSILSRKPETAQNLSEDAVSAYLPDPLFYGTGLRSMLGMDASISALDSFGDYSISLRDVSPEQCNVLKRVNETTPFAFMIQNARKKEDGYMPISSGDCLSEGYDDIYNVELIFSTQG